MLFNIFFQHWQFPRGGVEAGESDEECAVRELIEETGLRLVRLHPEWESVINYAVRIQQHTLERTIVYFLGEVAGKVVIDPAEHSEFRWVNAQEARRLLMKTSPEQLPVLDAMLAYLVESVSPSVESARLRVAVL